MYRRLLGSCDLVHVPFRWLVQCFHASVSSDSVFLWASQMSGKQSSGKGMWSGGQGVHVAGFLGILTRLQKPPHWVLGTSTLPPFPFPPHASWSQTLCNYQTHTARLGPVEASLPFVKTDSTKTLRQLSLNFFRTIQLAKYGTLS